MSLRQSAAEVRAAEAAVALARARLARQILDALNEGESYRAIGELTGLHYTRIGQIVREERARRRT